MSADNAALLDITFETETSYWQGVTLVLRRRSV
jgi:hypothetical protein